MSAQSSGSGRLSTTEREQYATNGFVVREAAFDADERAQIIDASEQLVDRLVRDRTGQRVKVSNYVFDSDYANGVVIKWEGDTDIVHGIEPFAHLSPALKTWGYDARFTRADERHHRP